MSTWPDDGYRAGAMPTSLTSMTATTSRLARRFPPRPPALARLAPGLGVTALGVAAAYAISLALPALSALIVAVVLGVITSHLPFLPSTARIGLTWAMRKLLRVGVVLLGLQLSLGQLTGLRAGSLLAVVTTVLVTFLGTLAIGGLLGVSRGLNLVVATGFSICGASAIAAVEGVADPDEREVATGVALVTLYGGLTIAAVPFLGDRLGLSGPALGAWAGLSVHEVAQVVAAASPAGAAAVATAVTVKLSRVVLLAPMVAAVGVVQRRRAPGTAGARPPIVPLFLAGFLVMIAARSTGQVPEAVLAGAGTLTTLLLTGALFALGTAVRIPELVRTGGRAVLLGLCSTLLIGTTAFATLQLFN